MGVQALGSEPSIEGFDVGIVGRLARPREVERDAFRVGLHTAGPYPARLARLLPRLDWVGFDVKAPFADYARITGVPGSGDRARLSLIELVRSGAAFEVRTTVHPLLLSEDDLARLDADLALLAVAPARRQPFRAMGCADDELVSTS